jgi:hypothetical protein
MTIPLAKSSQKSIENGTAQKRRCAPPTNWFDPRLWPQIAAAADKHDFSPMEIVNSLKSTPAGRAIYGQLWPGTVGHWIEKTESIEEPYKWTEKTLRKVQSGKRDISKDKPLGRPRILVSEQLKTLNALTSIDSLHILTSLQRLKRRYSFSEMLVHL